MDDVNRFQEALQKLMLSAQNAGNVISSEEIAAAFADLSLTKEQLAEVSRYLQKNQLEVEGYEEEELPTSFSEAAPGKKKGAKERASSYLRIYREELERIMPLEAEEEAQLFEDFLGGDEAARHRLVESRLLLAAEEAASFVGRGLPEADLIQEANLELLLTLAEYEGTLAELDQTIRLRIRSALDLAVEEETGSGDLQKYLASQANKLLDLSTELAEDLGRQPTVDELAERMNLTEEAVEEIMRMSLDAANVAEGQGEDHE
ncbi:MAG: hypothetical protein IJ773_06445 [Lachnospiraceae bacterium]|nr:hypothetical protein [Lachnospiraceae bacterium]